MLIMIVVLAWVSKSGADKASGSQRGSEKGGEVNHVSNRLVEWSV